MISYKQWKLLNEAIGGSINLGLKPRQSILRTPSSHANYMDDDMTFKKKKNKFHPDDMSNDMGDHEDEEGMGNDMGDHEDMDHDHDDDDHDEDDMDMPKKHHPDMDDDDDEEDDDEGDMDIDVDKDFGDDDEEHSSLDGEEEEEEEKEKDFSFKKGKPHNSSSFMKWEARENDLETKDGKETPAQDVSCRNKMMKNKCGKMMSKKMSSGEDEKKCPKCKKLGTACTCPERKGQPERLARPEKKGSEKKGSEKKESFNLTDYVRPDEIQDTDDEWLKSISRMYGNPMERFDDGFREDYLIAPEEPNSLEARPGQFGYAPQTRLGNDNNEQISESVQSLMKRINSLEKKLRKK